MSARYILAIRLCGEDPATKAPRWYQDERRNYVLMFLDTVLFTNAMAFLSVSTVIPYFLTRLGGGSFTVSLANALVSIGAVITQPYFTRRATRLKRKGRVFMRILVTQRIFLLGLVCLLPFLSDDHPHLTLVLFLAGWGVFNLFVGSYSPFYMSLFAKMIAVNQRGKLRGLSAATGNLLAMLAALLIGVLLKWLPYPWNYTTVFMIGCVLLILDALDFGLMREPEDAVQGADIDFFRYVRAVPALLREDRVFSRIVIAFSCLVIAQVSLAYYSLYAIHNLHVTAADIAIFTAISVAGTSVSSLVLGFVADKFSHRLVLEISAVCGILASVSVLTWHSLAGVCIAFALSTSCQGGYNLSSGMLVIGRAPQEKIPMYISTYVLFALVLSSVVTLGMSYVIDSVSFGAMFAFMGIAAAVGWYVLWSLRKADDKAVLMQRGEADVKM
ncbi:MAG: MFS transporter [Alicyclobacillus sp.]|nr:MFS transporter [Alicyclobacillus sp.]